MKPLDVDEHGYLAGRHEVSGKLGLIALLEQWLDASGAETIGDLLVDRRTAMVTGAIDGHRFVLHADTTRPAVEAVVRWNRPRPAKWRVVANARGPVNLVMPREDLEALPGWYCYVRDGLETPTLI